jgi:hypothetical protein
MMELYLHSAIRLHGVVLNSVSTGTTLSVPFPPSSFIQSQCRQTTFSYHSIQLVLSNATICSGKFRNYYKPRQNTITVITVVKMCCRVEMLKIRIVCVVTEMFYYFNYVTGVQIIET